MPMTRNAITTQFAASAKHMNRSCLLPKSPFGQHHSRPGSWECHTGHVGRSITHNISRLIRLSSSASAEFKHDPRLHVSISLPNEGFVFEVDLFVLDDHLSRHFVGPY